MVWGFVQDPSEKKVKHVLRAEADPKKCYVDGRIEKVLTNVERIGKEL